jgi:transposase
MRPAPPAFPLRRSAPRPWRPLTDIEWAALSAILHRSTRGRPPTLARYTWDAIFWVACSTRPWRALPESLGKADSAHRALRRAARAQHLHRMLLRVSDHPEFARNNPLRAIEWFIVRAYRRAFRITRIAIPPMPPGCRMRICPKPSKPSPRGRRRWPERSRSACSAPCSTSRTARRGSPGAGAPRIEARGAAPCASHAVTRLPAARASGPGKGRRAATSGSLRPPRMPGTIAPRNQAIPPRRDA